MEEVLLASELQGYVTQVLVQAGESVEVDQLLVVLTSRGVEASVDQARAALGTAQADLAAVRAGPRVEAIAAQQAQVAIAQAERNKAHAAAEAALAAWRSPQGLQLQVLEAEAQAAAASAKVDLAEAQYAQARHQADQADWGSTTRRVLDLQAQARQADLQAARADERAAQAALQHLQSMQANPLSHQAAAHRAQGVYEAAEAAVGVAQAQLRDLLAGPTEEEVAVAEASVALAQAQLGLAELQEERLTLKSPLAGTVLTRMANVGETALAGVPLLTVADLSEVYLTVYVPHTRLGQVSLGQSVDVAVDSFPQRRFEGQVVHIADQPQYTPRNVATKEERVNTVYAVKVRLANPQGLLKIGMAADAAFRP